MRVGLLVVLCLTLFGVISNNAQTCTSQDNVQYSTAGDTVVLYQVPDAATCCSRCWQYEECQYYTFSKSAKTCTIKNLNSGPTTTSNTDTTSGKSDRTITRGLTQCFGVENGIDYDNGFIASKYGSNQQDCCNWCLGYFGCNNWVINTGTGGCYLKASKLNRKTNSATIAGTVLDPQSATLRTGKRGIGWFDSSACTDLKKLTNVAWLYNWDSQPPALLVQCIKQLGIEYVPMIWDETRLDFTKVWTDSKYLLGFNEPNFGAQANLSPEAAAGYWPQLVTFANSNGMQLGSPSASAGGDLLDPITWFDRFFAALGGVSVAKVDFITTHIYTCGAVSVRDYLNQFKKYNKPIWLTEFACPSVPNPSKTVQQEADFLTSTLAYLDADPQFARYAYFGTRIAPGDGWLGTNVNLYDYSSASLTAVGLVYTNGGGSNPTAAPTQAPTQAPTKGPTSAPTQPPTQGPTAAPTKAPTGGPTSAPTKAPTGGPTAAPTQAPTGGPTSAPTKAPTQGPTTPPTAAPTGPASVVGNWRIKNKNGQFWTVPLPSQVVAVGGIDLQGAIFTIATITGGYTFESGGYYTSAENAGANPLISNRYTASGWETFTITSQGNGYFTFLASANGKLVAVQTANTVIPTVAANSNPIPDSALFALVPLPTPVGLTTVKFKSVSSNSWVTVGGQSLVYATATTQTSGSTFTLYVVNGGYNLQTNGQFTSADTYNGAALYANRATASDWETFALTQLSNGNYVITAFANNNFVQVVSGSNQLFATLTPTATPPTNAQFTITAA